MIVNTEFGSYDVTYADDYQPKIERSRAFERAAKRLNRELSKLPSGSRTGLTAAIRRLVARAEEEAYTSGFVYGLIGGQNVDGGE